MPNQGLTRFGLEHLYMFPYYQTREAYRAAIGEEPPAWNPNKPPKYWFDPEVRNQAKRNVVYDRVIAYSGNGIPLVDADSKPVTDVLLLHKDEAGTVNIPPKGPLDSNIPGADVPEIAPPLRELRDDEELFFVFPGVVAVQLKSHLEPDRGFTEEDRAIMLDIKRMLAEALTQ